jgi:hypothetical protein
MKALPDIGKSVYGALLLATLLSGCAAESVDLLFVTPGRFDYLGCADIADATRSAATREQELKTLIDRAEKDSFGAIVAAAAYRSEYLKAQGELKLLAEAARNKNCMAGPVTTTEDKSRHSP